MFRSTQIPRFPMGSLRGFSLIEIVLALGIISFALVGIMGLFPVAMKSAQNSQQETRATMIARQIFADLRTFPATNTHISTNSNILSPQQLVNLTQNGIYSNIHDSAGAPTSLNSENPQFRTEVVVRADTPIPGICRVQASIWPINAPSNTPPYVFVALLDQ